MLEQELEDFLSTNPYLIDRSLDGLRPARQISKGRHRLDLLFHKKTAAVIVELKRGPLDCEAVNQLIRYFREFSGDFNMAKRHYLVGQAPSDTEFQKMRALLRTIPFQIRFRLLGKHIPLHLMYDLHERKYIAYEPELSRLPNRYSDVKVWRL